MRTSRYPAAVWTPRWQTGVVDEKELALLPLVVRVRSARELRYRAFRFLHADHYCTAAKDGPRIEELATELGISLGRR